MKTVIAVFVFLFVLLVIVPATFGCGRCGVFGRGCKFAAPVHHVAPVIVKQPDTIQNIIFNNQSPGDLAPRGATVYGVSRALDLIAPNGALYLDQARRYTEASSEVVASARSIDSDILATEQVNAREREIYARGNAIAEAARALSGDTRTARGGVQTFRVTLKNGIPVGVSNEELPPLDPPLPAQDQPVPRGVAIGTGLVCLKCHAADGSGATKFVIDDTFDETKFSRAKAAIDAGTMPPKQNLSEAERTRELLKLSRLVPVQ